MEVSFFLALAHQAHAFNSYPLVAFPSYLFMDLAALILAVESFTQSRPICSAYRGRVHLLDRPRREGCLVVCPSNVTAASGHGRPEIREKSVFLRLAYPMRLSVFLSSYPTAARARPEDSAAESTQSLWNFPDLQTESRGRAVSHAPYVVGCMDQRRGVALDRLPLCESNWVLCVDVLSRPKRWGFCIEFLSSFYSRGASAGPYLAS